VLEIVQEIGAAAGAATVVGLAALSTLHLSQARDIERLREWAGRAPERSDPGLTVVPRRPNPRHRWFRTRSVVLALVGLLVLGGGVTQVTGDDRDDHSGNADVRSPRKSKRNDAAIDPGDVTVAVLNGTTVPGLAASLSHQVAAAGFDEGTINNYSDQQLAESVVQYAPGRQAEAKAVSGRLGITRREPARADTRALAPDATVIVIAGADKAP
jgi:hypothetical protein